MLCSLVPPSIPSIVPLQGENRIAAPCLKFTVNLAGICLWAGPAALSTIRQTQPPAGRIDEAKAAFRAGWERSCTGSRGIHNQTNGRRDRSPWSLSKREGGTPR
jgi:hypothetical protein